MNEPKLHIIAPNLTSEFCEDLDFIVGELLSRPEAKYIDKKAFIERLESSPKPIGNDQVEGIKYNYSNNLIVVGKHDGLDFRFATMEAIIMMAAGGNFIGTSILEAIGTGFTANLAQAMVGNESELIRNEDEQIIANQIALITNEDTLAKAFFTNQPKVLTDDLGVELTDDLFKYTNYNYRNRDKEGISYLGKIEEQLLNIFINGHGYSEDKLKEFKLNSFNGSHLAMDKALMYKSTDDFNDSLTSLNPKTNTI